MSSVSTSCSPSTPRRCLLSKMFQKPVSTQTHAYSNTSTSARDSQSTLVSPPGQSSPKKGGDPDAVLGTLASTYGWGGALVPALPSEPATTGKSKKAPRVKPTAVKQDAAAPASSTPHQPIRQPLTQAQREQAIVDLSSRYGHGSPLPGGRWGM